MIAGLFIDVKLMPVPPGRGDGTGDLGEMRKILMIFCRDF